MSYQKYDIEDFVNDPFFRKWVLNPNPESNHFWEKWLVSNQSKKRDVLVSRIIIKTLQFKEDSPTEDQKLALFDKINHTNQFNKEINKEEAIIRQINSGQERKKSRQFKLYNVIQYAAALSGLIILAFALLFYNSIDETIVEMSMIEKSNAKGQKTKIYLPDGSTVILNSSSKLIYPVAFTGAEREVYLSGEAFFEVVPDSAKQFIVRTDEITARVLGTSFNIKSFNGNGGPAISLVSGIVEIQSNNHQILVLAPGEKAQLHQVTGELIRNTFNYEEDVLWKDGILVFRKTPFRDVVQRLEQWYGIDFIIDQMPEKEFPVTGKFDNEYLSNILQSISFTARFQYEIKGNEVYVKFKN
jgi:transmembrane sensor